MKFFTILAALAAAATAQHVTIFNPTAGTTVKAGQSITVSVVEANSLSSIANIGVGIGIEPSSSTFPGTVGTVLFTGAYAPTFDSATQNMPNQNFTVKIPASLPSGSAVLSVVHSALIGASGTIFNEVVNVTLNVE